jgi:hypothetical protein
MGQTPSRQHERGQVDHAQTLFAPVFGLQSHVTAFINLASPFGSHKSIFDSFIITPASQPISNGMTNQELLKKYGDMPYFNCRQGDNTIDAVLTKPMAATPIKLNPITVDQVDFNIIDHYNIVMLGRDNNNNNNNDNNDPINNTNNCSNSTTTTTNTQQTPINSPTTISYLRLSLINSKPALARPFLMVLRHYTSSQVQLDYLYHQLLPLSGLSQHQFHPKLPLDRLQLKDCTTLPRNGVITLPPPRAIQIVPVNGYQFDAALLHQQPQFHTAPQQFATFVIIDFINIKSVVQFYRFLHQTCQLVQHGCVFSVTTVSLHIVGFNLQLLDQLVITPEQVDKMCQDVGFSSENINHHMCRLNQNYKDDHQNDWLLTAGMDSCLYLFPALMSQDDYFILYDKVWNTSIWPLYFDLLQKGKMTNFTLPSNEFTSVIKGGDTDNDITIIDGSLNLLHCNVVKDKLNKQSQSEKVFKLLQQYPHLYVMNPIPGYDLNQYNNLYNFANRIVLMKNTGTNNRIDPKTLNKLQSTYSPVFGRLPDCTVPPLFGAYVLYRLDQHQVNAHLNSINIIKFFQQSIDSIATMKFPWPDHDKLTLDFKAQIASMFDWFSRYKSKNDSNCSNDTHTHDNPIPYWSQLPQSTTTLPFITNPIQVQFQPSTNPKVKCLEQAEMSPDYQTIEFDQPKFVSQTMYSVEGDIYFNQQQQTTTNCDENDQTVIENDQVSMSTDPDSTNDNTNNINDPDDQTDTAAEQRDQQSIHGNRTNRTLQHNTKTKKPKVNGNPINIISTPNGYEIALPSIFEFDAGITIARHALVADQYDYFNLPTLPPRFLIDRLDDQNNNTQTSHSKISNKNVTTLPPTHVARQEHIERCYKSNSKSLPPAILHNKPYSTPIPQCDCNFQHFAVQTAFQDAFFYEIALPLIHEKVLYNQLPSINQYTAVYTEGRLKFQRFSTLLSQKQPLPNIQLPQLLRDMVPHLPIVQHLGCNSNVDNSDNDTSSNKNCNSTNHTNNHNNNNNNDCDDLLFVHNDEDNLPPTLYLNLTISRKDKTSTTTKQESCNNNNNGNNNNNNISSSNNNNDQVNIISSSSLSSTLSPTTPTTNVSGVVVSRLHSRWSFQHEYQQQLFTINMTYMARTNRIFDYDNQNIFGPMYRNAQCFLPYQHVFNIHIIPYIYVNQHPHQIFQRVKSLVMSSKSEHLGEDYRPFVSKTTDITYPAIPTVFNGEDLPIPSLQPLRNNHIFQNEHLNQQQRYQQYKAKMGTDSNFNQPETLGDLFPGPIAQLDLLHLITTMEQQCPLHIIILCCNTVRDGEGELVAEDIIDSPQLNGTSRYTTHLAQCGLLTKQQFDYLQQTLPERYKNELLYTYLPFHSPHNFDRLNAMVKFHFVTTAQLPALFAQLQSQAIDRRIHMYQQWFEQQLQH